MLNSTAAYTAAQVSLARRPTATFMIKDYAILNGDINDDDTSNVIGGSAENGLATKITPAHDTTIENIQLFLKSDDNVNADIAIEIQTASAGKPSGNAVSSGAGKIFSFTDQSIGWRQAKFAGNPQLSSGVDYYIVANTTGSTYSYFWAEDEAFTGGEWWIDVGNGGTWTASATGKALISKLVETKQAVTGVITGLVGSGGSGTIQSSAQSWTPSAYEGRMCEISASGASGDGDNLGMSFVILGNTVSSIDVDLDPVVRGVVVGDSFFIENLNNFVDISEIINFSLDDQRDRTINIGKATMFNDNNTFFQVNPRSSNLKTGNEVIAKIGFSGAEKLQQFRGNILDSSVVDKKASLTFQDVMGNFQRKPTNIAGLSGIDYEDVIKRICQRYDIPFIADLSGQTIASGFSFSKGSEALAVMNKTRESLGWRLYGDNFGRVRFRQKVTASDAVFDIGEDDFILNNGLRFARNANETINILAATNVSAAISYGDEVLIGAYTGSASASNLSVNFTSAGIYSNLWWEDSINNGSVFIQENGLSRSTGKVASGTGLLNYDVQSVAGSASYQINIYGTPVTLSGTNFYVERTDGEGQLESGINVTRLLVNNTLFKSTSMAESFLDSNIVIKGKDKSLPIVKCRGIGDLEIEDTVTVDHDAIDSSILYLIKGQRKKFSSGGFTTDIYLEDTLVRSGDIRYDIGLRTDQGLRYDGG